MPNFIKSMACFSFVFFSIPHLCIICSKKLRKNIDIRRNLFYYSSNHTR
nr:MAG TPA: hypothetical protein [Caudoviricetes sp.]